RYGLEQKAAEKLGQKRQPLHQSRRMLAFNYRPDSRQYLGIAFNQMIETLRHAPTLRTRLPVQLFFIQRRKLRPRLRRIALHTRDQILKVRIHLYSCFRKTTITPESGSST